MTDQFTIVDPDKTGVRLSSKIGAPGATPGDVMTVNADGYIDTEPASGGGAVDSVTAADTSIVIGGTATDPTVATGTLDVIATDHPPAANWSNNSKKITGLANGSASSDAAAFGQIPTALPPNGSAGGDLTGTYPSPTVAKINGVSISVNIATALSGLLTVDAQTGTTYTLALADAGAIVTLSNASPIAVSIPTNATTAFPVGTAITLVAIGAGQVTVSAAAGATVNGANGLKLSKQYSAGLLIQYAANTWVLMGDTST